MKCQVCGTENPEGQKFCGSCGAEIPVPPSGPQVVESPVASPKQSWIRAHRIVVVLIVVVIVVLASIGLVYTQPLSKIKILAQNLSGYHASYSIMIDGTQKALGTIYPGDHVVEIGVWSVKTGSHSVQVDCHFLGHLGSNLDGIMEYSYEYSVGPVYTKDIYITLDPDIPNLVGDLTLYYDDGNNEISVEGRVYNYANATCGGTLEYTVQDGRGWIMTDTVLLGRFDGNGDYADVYEVYDWPNYIDGQYNTGYIPSWSYTLTFE